MKNDIWNKYALMIEAETKDDPSGNFELHLVLAACRYFERMTKQGIVPDRTWFLKKFGEYKARIS